MTSGPDCPCCGQPLAPRPGLPTTAPWLCTPCTRGWWNAELTDTARAAWDHETRSFGTSPDAAVIDAAVGDERSAAILRGSNQEVT